MEERLSNKQNQTTNDRPRAREKIEWYIKIKTFTCQFIYWNQKNQLSPEMSIIITIIWHTFVPQQRSENNKKQKSMLMSIMREWRASEAMAAHRRKCITNIYVRNLIRWWLRFRSFAFIVLLGRRPSERHPSKKSIANAPGTVGCRLESQIEGKREILFYAVGSLNRGPRFVVRYNRPNGYM